MSKQQEFLDHLKNPTKARLVQAVNEFYENHRNSLQSAFVYEHYEGEFTIEIWADNHGILYTTELILGNTIKKYLKRPMINVRNVRNYPEAEDRLFRRSFYVTET